MDVDDEFSLFMAKQIPESNEIPFKEQGVDETPGDDKDIKKKRQDLLISLLSPFYAEDETPSAYEGENEIPFISALENQQDAGKIPNPFKVEELLQAQKEEKFCRGRAN